MICYIGVGSNLGDRLAYIKKSVVLLKKNHQISIKKISPIYETAPCGGPKGQKGYLNLTLKLETELEPLELLAQLKKIERDSGRGAGRARWAAREIDLDILLCGKRVVKEKGLEVPHPLMHKRSFVLKPLSDIAPRLMHPVLKKSIKILLESIR